jgi:hypothetical protein
MIKRFVGKISDDSSVNGLINLIAKMTGLQPAEIHLPDETLSKFKLIQEEKLEILGLINPFYDQLKSLNTKESKKKIYELIDLGKFLVYSNFAKDVKIIECGEQPDFLIKYRDNVIGIEHTSIYDDEIVAEIRSIKKIIKKCQAKISNERSDVTGVYNLIVFPKKFMAELKVSERRTIEKINNYIIATRSNSVIEKPDIISDIIHTESSTLELVLGEKYWLKNLTTESISKTVFKKEVKIDTYKKLKNIKECWLLIVFGGASSDSSFNIELENLPRHLTPFDKIFIFDNFKGRII